MLMDTIKTEPGSGEPVHLLSTTRPQALDGLWERWSRRLKNHRTFGSVVTRALQDKRLYDEWRTWRSDQPESKEDEHWPIVSLESSDLVRLDYWLARFISEIGKTDSPHFKCTSARLITVAGGLQRYIRHSAATKGFTRQWMQDSRFRLFVAALDSRRQELRALEAQIAKETQRADVITQEDEDTLWETGTISTSTPQGLLYGVYFYNSIMFLPAFNIPHSFLQTDQFAILRDDDDESGAEYLAFDGHKTKRDLRNSRGKPTKEAIRHYAEPSSPRCLVKLYKEFLALPRLYGGHFYDRPLTGHNGVKQLSSYMQDMFTAAGISLEGRVINADSGRATYEARNPPPPAVTPTSSPMDPLVSDQTRMETDPEEGETSCMAWPASSPVPSTCLVPPVPSTPPPVFSMSSPVSSTRLSPPGPTTLPSTLSGVSPIVIAPLPPRSVDSSVDSSVGPTSARTPQILGASSRNRKAMSLKRTLPPGASVRFVRSRPSRLLQVLTVPPVVTNTMSLNTSVSAITSVTSTYSRAPRVYKASAVSSAVVNAMPIKPSMHTRSLLLPTSWASARTFQPPAMSREMTAEASVSSTFAHPQQIFQAPAVSPAVVNNVSFKPAMHTRSLVLPTSWGSSQMFQAPAVTPVMASGASVSSTGAHSQQMFQAPAVSPAVLNNASFKPTMHTRPLVLPTSWGTSQMFQAPTAAPVMTTTASDSSTYALTQQMSHAPEFSPVILNTVSLNRSVPTMTSVEPVSCQPPRMFQAAAGTPVVSPEVPVSPGSSEMFPSTSSLTARSQPVSSTCVSPTTQLTRPIKMEVDDEDTLSNPWPVVESDQGSLHEPNRLSPEGGCESSSDHTAEAGSKITGECADNGEGMDRGSWCDPKRGGDESRQVSCSSHSSPGSGTECISCWPSPGIWNEADHGPSHDPKQTGDKSQRPSVNNSDKERSETDPASSVECHEIRNRTNNESGDDVICTDGENHDDVDDDGAKNGSVCDITEKEVEARVDTDKSKPYISEYNSEKGTVCLMIPPSVETVVVIKDGRRVALTL